MANDSTVAAEQGIRFVKGPSSAFAILFAISAILHIYQNTKNKRWRLLWLTPCGSIIIAAGFICREYHAFHPLSDTVSATQGLLYAGAIVFSTSLYLSLFEFFWSQPQLSPLKPGLVWGTLSFFGSGVISITAQGASTYFNPTAKPSTVRAGHIMLEVSFVLQLVLLVALVGLLTLFKHRCSQIRAFDGDKSSVARNATLLLYGSAALLFVVATFRTGQIFSDFGSTAWRTEALFWVLDATPLLLCSFYMNWMFPAVPLHGATGTPCAC